MLFPPQEEIKAAKSNLIKLARDAWYKGLFSAFNGNISLRFSAPYSRLVLITGQCTAKGQLDEQSLSFMDLATGNCIDGCAISSEKEVHRAIYTSTKASAIFHTHPSKLMVCALKGYLDHITELPIFEVRLQHIDILRVPAIAPGSVELANAVQNVLIRACKKDQLYQHIGSIWLEEHGLCTYGQSLQEAEALSEELEHLAEIVLLKKN